MRHSTARLINSIVLLGIVLVATLFLFRACSARVADTGSEAVPEVQAHADFIPDDPGTLHLPGGWAELQWNFAGPNGVGAPTAWDNLESAGVPGATGVTVAVVDTGIAYATRYPYRR